MPRTGVAIACAACVGLGAASAGAIPLLNGPGGPLDFGMRVLSNNDDDSTPPIDLTPTFPSGVRLAGVDHHALYVNNNGNVTFGAARSAYVPGMFPSSFPMTFGQAMIAGWWADVDTRGVVSNMTDNAVYLRQDAGLLVVTWYNVGYYAQHADRLNAFQVALRRAPCGGCTDFEVEFRYNRCEWTTSDTSMTSLDGSVGELARAGFDLPAPRALELPGSGTPAIVNLCTMSNVDAGGRWLYCVRSGTPTSGPCAPLVMDAGVIDASIADAARTDAQRTDGARAETGPADAAPEPDAPEPADARPAGYQPPPLRFRGGGCQCATASIAARPAPAPGVRGGGSAIAAALAMAAAALAAVSGRSSRRATRS